MVVLVINSPIKILGSGCNVNRNSFSFLQFYACNCKSTDLARIGFITTNRQHTLVESFPLFLLFLLKKIDFKMYRISCLNMISEIIYKTSMGSEKAGPSFVQTRNQNEKKLIVIHKSFSEHNFKKKMSSTVVLCQPF